MADLGKNGYEQFGGVTVYKTTDSEFALYGKPKEVKINWSCCGSVSIAEAEKFYHDFGKALELAKAEEEKLKDFS